MTACVIFLRVKFNFKQKSLDLEDQFLWLAQDVFKTGEGHQGALLHYSIQPIPYAKIPIVSLFKILSKSASYRMTILETLVRSEIG